MFVSPALCPLYVLVVVTLWLINEALPLVTIEPDTERDEVQTQTLRVLSLGHSDIVDTTFIRTLLPPGVDLALYHPCSCRPYNTSIT